MQRFIAEFVMWTEAEEERHGSPPPSPRQNNEPVEAASTTGGGKAEPGSSSKGRVGHWSKAKLELQQVLEELKYSGNLLATGISNLQNSAGAPKKSASQALTLEGSAVALMAAMKRLGEVTKSVDEFMVAELHAQPEEPAASKSGPGKDLCPACSCKTRGLEMVDSSAPELLARAYSGKAAMMRRWEALEAKVFQEAAAKRVLQRKLQEQKAKTKEAARAKETERSQIGTLADIVKRAQREKTSAVRAMASLNQENTKLRQQLEIQSGDIESARYENQRVNKRCEDLEGRLVSNTIAPTPPSVRRSASTSGASGAGHRDLNVKTRMAYSNPRVGATGATQSTRRPLTARSIGAKSQDVEIRAQSVRSQPANTRPGRIRPQTATERL